MFATRMTARGAPRLDYLALWFLAPPSLWILALLSLWILALLSLWILAPLGQRILAPLSLSMLVREFAGPHLVRLVHTREGGCSDSAARGSSNIGFMRGPWYWNFVCSADGPSISLLVASPLCTCTSRLLSVTMCSPSIQYALGDLSGSTLYLPADMSLEGEPNRKSRCHVRPQG